MNKKHALLAVAGLIVLTGCETKIMDGRVYVPSQEAAGGKYDAYTSDNKTFGEVPAAENTPAETTDVAVRPVDGTSAAPAPAPAPAPGYTGSGFAPMEDTKSSGGIVSNGKKSGKKSGKRVSAKGGTYVVKSGDTLGGIARRHGVSLSALLEANKMTMQDAKKLTIGKKLVIPGAGKKAASGKKVSGKKNAPAAEKGYYIVQRGDFPQRIARRNKVKLADLLKANNLTMESARRLQIGQKLIIPGAGAAAAEAAPAEKEAPVAPVEQKTETVTPVTPVEKADSTAAKIEESMPVENTPSAAAPTTGATTPVEVTEDTTVKDFAAKYKVTEEWFRANNPTISGDTIRQGELVVVPEQN